MGTPARYFPANQGAASKNGPTNAGLARTPAMDKLIRHVNRSERYSFESVCKSISEAVSKAKHKA